MTPKPKQLAGGGHRGWESSVYRRVCALHRQVASPAAWRARGRLLWAWRGGATCMGFRLLCMCAPLAWVQCEGRGPCSAGCDGGLQGGGAAWPRGGRAGVCKLQGQCLLKLGCNGQTYCGVWCRARTRCRLLGQRLHGARYAAVMRLACSRRWRWRGSLTLAAEQLRVGTCSASVYSVFGALTASWRATFRHRRGWPAAAGTRSRCSEARRQRSAVCMQDGGVEALVRKGVKRVLHAPAAYC